MRGHRRPIAKGQLVQILDRRHDKLLEGDSSKRAAAAVFHLLLPHSAPDGGAESGEVSQVKSVVDLWEAIP